MKEWSHEERFISNHGKGPWTARILCVGKKPMLGKPVYVAQMERWRGSSKPIRFELPFSFLSSPSCGWAAKCDE